MASNAVIEAGVCWWAICRYFTCILQAIEGFGTLRIGRWQQQMVPIKEMTDVLRVVKEVVAVKPKQWVRLKRGIYKDDLAQVGVGTWGFLMSSVIPFKHDTPGVHGGGGGGGRGAWVPPPPSLDNLVHTFDFLYEHTHSRRCNAHKNMTFFKTSNAFPAIWGT